MLYCDWIDASEGIDVNKSNESRKQLFVMMITFLK